MEAVIRYLDEHDPAAADRARRRYECLQPYSGESTAYGRAVLLGVSESCRRQVLHELVELRRRAGDFLRGDGLAAEDEYFVAEQNAAVVADAEEYYRTMLGAAAASWNLRDRHMADTLDQLMAHLDRHNATSRVVVWEHDSHIGDARFTEMAGRGEINIGQLMRERHGRDVVLVGFTTSVGTVTAAADWGAPAERSRVRLALPRSYEALFPRDRDPRVPALPAPNRSRRQDPGRAATGAGDRRRLPPRDGAPEPLVQRERRPAVRRPRAHRRHPCRGTAGAFSARGDRRAAGDLPERHLTTGHR